MVSCADLFVLVCMYTYQVKAAFLPPPLHYINMLICIRKHACPNVHTYTHTRTHTYIHAYTFAHTYIHACTFTHTYTHQATGDAVSRISVLTPVASIIPSDHVRAPPTAKQLRSEI